ncbi:Transmembrane protein [Globisporangium polare]
MDYESLSTPAVPPLPPLEGLRRRSIHVHVREPTAPLGPSWTYPSAGTSQEVVAPEEEVDEIRDHLAKPRHRLGQWPSTAICGNDILSSVLYSSGIVAQKAGKLMPIPLLLVSTVLYFFRFIYEEVVTAIPLNGGSYNVLLNTTSKRFAAFGAALGIISYLATGVVSGTSAINYLGTQVSGLATVPWTILLLFLFAVLNLIGIAESAVVALVIFCFHVLTLSVLTVVSFVYTVQHTHVIRDNMHTSLPPVDFAGSLIDSNVFDAIFFGFGAAMLGITGFESSAQFVEEQQPGVFRKTLRNMWGLSTFFNLALSIMALGVLPLDEIIHKSDTVLAEMGRVAGGRWLETWVAIDAFIVLSGAVLTSYVGITGLARRLAFDRVLPAFLMKQNKWRKTNHSIILSYFVLASSLVLLLNADTSTLSGVYSYAFLGLMSLFAFGCMALKAKRSEIPRDVFAPWWTCIMGFCMVVIGLIAILLGDPKILMYFAVYLLVIGFVMAAMMQRVQILRFALIVMKQLFPSRTAASSGSEGNALPSPRATATGDSAPLQGQQPLARTGARGGRTITKAIIGIKLAPIVYFCKHPDMTIINKAILYVRKNELTQTLRIVHVYDEDRGNLNVDNDGGIESGGKEDKRALLEEFANIVALFDNIYPKLQIDFVCVRGRFEPALVQWIAKSMDIPINMMFIAQPGDHGVHRVATLGVRVITG